MMIDPPHGDIHAEFMAQVYALSGGQHASVAYETHAHVQTAHSLASRAALTAQAFHADPAMHGRDLQPMITFSTPFYDAIYVLPPEVLAQHNEAVGLLATMTRSILSRAFCFMAPGYAANVTAEEADLMRDVEQDVMHHPRRREVVRLDAGDLREAVLLFAPIIRIPEGERDVLGRWEQGEPRDTIWNAIGRAVWAVNQ